MIEVFDEKAFLANVDKCYLDPLTADHIFLCHLNLVFAIGLTFATPVPGTRDAEVIDSLRARSPDQSEIFLLNAKSINNPLVGFEDADLWSIQALLLMALYMLLKTKRNHAYAYIGMSLLGRAIPLRHGSSLTAIRYGSAHGIYPRFAP